MSVSSTGQKLRNSCDACNLAKLKCSQMKPSCARCEAQGVKCVYGVSMRAGKHRATRSNIQKPSPETRALHRESISTPTYPVPDRSQSQPFDPSYSSIIDSMPLNGDWSTFLNDECNPYLANHTMDLDDDNLSTTRQSSQSNLLHNQSESALSAAMSTHPDMLGGATQPPVSHDILSLATQTANPHDLITVKPQQLSPASSRGQSMSRAHSLSTSTLVSEAQPSPLMQSTGACLCGQRILQHLLTLTKISDVPVTFDTALNQNKQIIALCHNILNDQRHHHHDTSFMLNFTALIAKVITVYESIYKPTRSTRTSSRGSSVPNNRSLRDVEMSNNDHLDSNGMSGEHWLNSTSSTCFSGMMTPPSVMLPLPLTMGTYRLEEKDEEKLKMDIFRMEMTKVASLVKAFEIRLREVDSDEGPTNYELKAYGDMVAYLQTRLRVSLEIPKD